MIRSIIVDDEKNSSEILAWQLEKYCPSVEVIAVCNAGREAVEIVPRLKPELVFLDIQMPDINGFQVLQALNPFDFEVIFTTSYDEYALKAFKYNALDYLLKPIDFKELENAIQKFEQRSQGRLSTFGNASKPKRIALTTTESLLFIDPSDILYCEGNSNYTYFHLLPEPRKILVSKTLKEVEELLRGLDFFRVHNSYIVNMNYIKEYVRGDGGYVVLKNGAHLTVSKSRKEQFFNLFSKL